MEIESNFVGGAKAVLVAILRALKDLNRSNTLSLRFSEEGGLHSHFSCGPGGDAKAAFASFRLFPASDDFENDRFPPVSFDNIKGRAEGLGKLTRKLQNNQAHPFSLLKGERTASLFLSLRCDPEQVNTNDDGLVVVLAVHPKTIFHQMELVDEWDRVSIRSERAETGCELYFESLDLGRKVLYEMDFVPNKIDPIVHRLPSPPPNGYAFVVQIEAKEYIRTIAALHDASDRVSITGTKNSIMFESSGPNGTLQVGLSQKFNNPSKLLPRFKILQFLAPIKQSFNTRYLLAFAHAVHLGTSVVLSFPPNPASGALNQQQQFLYPGNNAGSRNQSPHTSRPASPQFNASTASSSTSNNTPINNDAGAAVRPAHSHLRISHPIEVITVRDPLNLGTTDSAHDAFKLASTALASSSSGNSSSGSGNGRREDERDSILENRKVVGFLEYFLAPELDG
ncbi:UNVERIFIED_CONTAM: hypothetical protein HDU68_011005 [Siphonaria sp. JEL0065]|nr:hypothetical protein HDU68_011005 [Siphonaria sp. JEL0065]